MYIFIMHTFLLCVTGVNEKHEPAEKHETRGKSARWKNVEEVGRNNVRLLPVIYINLITGGVAVQRLSASSLSRMHQPHAKQNYDSR